MFYLQCIVINSNSFFIHLDFEIKKYSSLNCKTAHSFELYTLNKRKKFIYAMSELESELEQKTILSSNDFKIPTKCVKAAQDILVWEKSDAYQVIEATLIVGIRPICSFLALFIKYKQPFSSMICFVGIYWIHFCGWRLHQRKKD